jgi:hypothetical protein
VYTIFKNLTIILIVRFAHSAANAFTIAALTLPLQAYGEVIWFGGRVTALTLVSFVFMVCLCPIGCFRLHAQCHLSPYAQVLSSVIAAWSDISDALTAGDPAVLESEGWGFQHFQGIVAKVNVGYFWMLINCLTSAAYVRVFLHFVLSSCSSSCCRTHLRH